MTSTQRAILKKILIGKGIYAKKRVLRRSSKYKVYDENGVEIIDLELRTFSRMLKDGYFIPDTATGLYKITEKSLNYKFKKSKND